jgi:hypothetical protein
MLNQNSVKNLQTTDYNAQGKIKAYLEYVTFSLRITKNPKRGGSQ